jgi:hypothetical protein
VVLQWQYIYSKKRYQCIEGSEGFRMLKRLTMTL